MACALFSVIIFIPGNHQNVMSLIVFKCEKFVLVSYKTIIYSLLLRFNVVNFCNSQSIFTFFTCQQISINFACEKVHDIEIFQKNHCEYNKKSSINLKLS